MASAVPELRALCRFCCRDAWMCSLFARYHVWVTESGVTARVARSQSNFDFSRS